METLSKLEYVTEIESCFNNKSPFSQIEIGKLSSYQVREAATHLVRNGRETIAAALVDAAIAIYPNEPNVLAMAGLLSMERQDWEGACEYLYKLLTVQGIEAPATNYLMLAKAQICNLDLSAAVTTLEVGLIAHPDDASLADEYQKLSKAGMAQEIAAITCQSEPA